MLTALKEPIFRGLKRAYFFFAAQRRVWDAAVDAKRRKSEGTDLP